MMACSSSDPTCCVLGSQRAPHLSHRFCLLDGGLPLSVEKVTGEKSTVKVKGHHGGTQVIAGGTDVVKHAGEEVRYFRT